MQKKVFTFLFFNKKTRFFIFASFLLIKKLTTVTLQLASYALETLGER